MDFGRGVIKKKGGERGYFGTIPSSNDGERVVMIKESDLEEVLKNKIELLLKTGKEMPKRLYQSYPIKDEKGEIIGEIPSEFPDEVDYKSNDGKLLFKLYLDRKIYTNNSKDMMFIRYVSIDQAVIEENLFCIDED